MQYQFRIDNRSAAPKRDEWEDAAWDAVEAGYATWVDPNSVKLDSNQGATIARIRDR